MRPLVRVGLLAEPLTIKQEDILWDCNVWCALKTRRSQRLSPAPQTREGRRQTEPFWVRHFWGILFSCKNDLFDLISFELFCPHWIILWPSFFVQKTISLHWYISTVLHTPDHCRTTVFVPKRFGLSTPEETRSENGQPARTQAIPYWLSK